MTVITGGRNGGGQVDNDGAVYGGDDGRRLIVTCSGSKQRL